MRKFKLNDIVFSARKGKGKVIDIRSDTEYNIRVVFGNDYETYTDRGKYNINDLYPEIYHLDNMPNITVFDNDYIIHGFKLNFKKFLESKGIVWEDFLRNCKLSNQRWCSTSNYYTSITQLKIHDPLLWLRKAFYWEHNMLGLDIDTINSINEEWYKLIDGNDFAVVFE